MSAIQKKPYIRNVLDSMEDEEKVTLLQLVDGKQNKPIPKSLINPSQHVTGADKLLTPEYIALETKEGVYTGYLIYNDDYCTLVAYEDGSQNLDILDIDLSNMTYSVNKENTSIADMRFEIEQSKEKMDVVDYIKEALKEGQIVVGGGAIVVSLSNVNLSTGTASAALSSDDFAIAADEDKPCVLQMGLSTQSVWPVGDLVELNRISVVANTSATFAGVVNGCVINAVFTSGAGTVTIQHLDEKKILTILSLGTATDDQLKEIKEGRVLAINHSGEFYYREDYSTSNAFLYIKLYPNYTSSSGQTSYDGIRYRQPDAQHEYGYLQVASQQHSYFGVSALGGAAGNISLGSGLSMNGKVLSASVPEDIVTISATGVQSDAMAAKIENAKALIYSNRMYVIDRKDHSTIRFNYDENSSSADSHMYLSYDRESKRIVTATSAYNRVTAIGGKYGSVSVDSSLQTAETLGLTGKLPYLDTAPTADNTSGFLTIVVLSAEPATRYNGYLYVITAAAA